MSNREQPADPLTAEEIRAWAEYDPAGHLVRAGKAMGHVTSRGYVACYIRGARHRLHRLIWLHQRGEWPTADIDHINGDPLDNRIENLRDVSKHINQQNRQGPMRTNKLGMLGVYFEASSGTYRASIWVNGRTKNIGRYPTPELAQAAHLDAKRRLHEGNTL